MTDIDLELHPGLILLLGPNGCGKSTLLRLLAGVEMADSGRIFINGTDLWEHEIRARSQLVYVPEYPDLTPYASIHEVMGLVCRLRGQPVEVGSDALKKAGVEHLRNRTIRELSNGQRRRAVFAFCLVGTSSVILLDEPLEGMDARMRKTILAWIKERLSDGAAVLVASHAIQPFLPLVDQAVSLREGGAVHHENLPSEPGLRERFLENLAAG